MFSHTAAKHDKMLAAFKETAFKTRLVKADLHARLGQGEIIPGTHEDALTLRYLRGK